MKKSNIGLAGWIIIVILWIMALVNRFWYVIVAIIALIAIILYFKRKPQEAKHHNKLNSETTKHAQQANPSVTPQTNEHFHDYIPDPHNYDEVFDYAKMEPPIMRLENHKYLNSWTHNYTSSPNSLMQTQNKIKPRNNWPFVFHHLLQLADINADEAIQQYLEVTATTYYEGALLAYKRGDLEKAEIWFLKVFDLLPIKVAKRLSIIYGKQHRYADIVHVYIQAIAYTDNWYIFTTDNDLAKLAEAKEKAKTRADKHTQDDQSKGFNTPISLIDRKFLNELNAAWIAKKQP